MVFSNRCFKKILWMSLVVNIFKFSHGCERCSCCTPGRFVFCFRGISFFSLLLEFPKIYVPFIHSYSARLFTVILPRKNAKDLKDGGIFPKRLSLQYVSLPAGSVGGRFRTQLQPCRWKRIKFCGRYLCFLLLALLGIPACFRLSYIVGKNVDVDCWFPWRNVDAAAAKRRNCCLLLQKKENNFPSRPIKRLARKEVQPRCFLLTWYEPKPRPTGIRKFRSNEVQFHWTRKSYRKFHSNGKRTCSQLIMFVKTSLLHLGRLPVTVFTGSFENTKWPPVQI